MSSLNISLPDSMKDFVERQAKEQGYSTVSEYMRAVIRNIQQEQSNQEAELSKKRLNTLNLLRQEMKNLPVKNPKDKFSNREHDQVLYIK